MNDLNLATSFAPLQNDTFFRACLRQATDEQPDLRLLSSLQRT
jgi:hypothetical protein